MEKITSCHLSFSCWHLVSRFVLCVARYAIEQTKNKLLNNQIKSVQDLMTDLGLFSIKKPLLPLKKWDKPWSITEKSLNLQV